MLKGRFLAIAAALMLCAFVGAQAQTNTIYAHNESSLVGVQKGIADITIDGDLRTYGTDPVDNSVTFPLTTVLDLEVWFATISGATSAQATKAKLYSWRYSSSTGNTTITIEVPSVSNNPYIQVMRNISGSYTQLREFRPGTPGNGGTFIARPLVQWNPSSGALVGFWRGLEGTGRTLPHDLGSSIISNAYTSAAQASSLSFLIHGAVVTGLYVELAVGGTTVTRSGAAVVVNAIGALPGYSLVTVDVPVTLVGSGSVNTVNVRVKDGFSGTYSPARQLKAGS